MMMLDQDGPLQERNMAFAALNNLGIMQIQHNAVKAAFRTFASALHMLQQEDDTDDYYASQTNLCYQILERERNRITADMSFNRHVALQTMLYGTDPINLSFQYCNMQKIQAGYASAKVGPIYIDAFDIFGFDEEEDLLAATIMYNMGLTLGLLALCESDNKAFATKTKAQNLLKMSLDILETLALACDGKEDIVVWHASLSITILALSALRLIALDDKDLNDCILIDQKLRETLHQASRSKEMMKKFSLEIENHLARSA